MDELNVLIKVLKEFKYSTHLTKKEKQLFLNNTLNFISRKSILTHHKFFILQDTLNFHMQNKTVTAGFDWGKTPEGVEYWLKLNRRLRKKESEKDLDK